MSWKGESRRHSLAKKGIKTASGTYMQSFNPKWKAKYNMGIAIDRYLELTEIQEEIKEIRKLINGYAKYGVEYEATFEIDGREFTVRFNYYDPTQDITDLHFMPKDSDEMDIFEEMWYDKNSRLIQEREKRRKKK